MENKLLLYAKEMGITLPSNAQEKFLDYYRLLVEENQRVNLTRITGVQEAMIKHFLDSLQLLAWQVNPTGPLLDVGSGAGFPGIPLKIARPGMPLVLLDSSGKRVAFLLQLISLLGLPEAQAQHGRAEDFGRDTAWREQFPLVVSRAVARLNILAELCLPFVAPGGFFVAYKGPEGTQESEDAQSALSQLSSKVEQIIPYSLPEGLGERNLIVIVKEGVLSDKFPRRAGIPGKHPL